MTIGDPHAVFIELDSLSRLRALTLSESLKLQEAMRLIDRAAEKWTSRRARRAA